MTKWTEVQRFGSVGVEISLSEELLARADEKTLTMPIYRKSHREQDANIVGGLGEVVFEDWLEREGVAYEWLGETRFDYRLNNQTVELKTKDRTAPPRPSYEVSIPDYNSEHQRADWLFFISLQRSENTFFRAFLCGAYEGPTYRDGARFWQTGETDPSNGTKFWTACWNRPISDLVTPKDFMERMRDGR